MPFLSTIAVAQSSDLSNPWRCECVCGSCCVPSFSVQVFKEQRRDHAWDGFRQKYHGPYLREVCMVLDHLKLLPSCLIHEILKFVLPERPDCQGFYEAYSKMPTPTDPMFYMQAILFWFHASDGNAATFRTFLRRQYQEVISACRDWKDEDQWAERMLWRSLRVGPVDSTCVIH